MKWDEALDEIKRQTLAVCNAPLRMPVPGDTIRLQDGYVYRVLDVDGHTLTLEGRIEVFTCTVHFENPSR